MRTALPRSHAYGTTLALVAALSLLPPAALADGPGERPASRPKGTTAEARQAARDLRALAAAARAEAKRPEKGASLTELRSALGVPKRVVEPPTLTPAEVDALLAKTLGDAGVRAAGRTTDEEFLRRVSLDVAGTLPTPEQIAALVADPDPGKRAALIDRLLDGPDYPRRWARYWRDIIRTHATFTNPRLVDYDALEHWLADRLEANAPWDEIARAMISTGGTAEENGATVLAAAHQARPVEVAGEVSRIFLGVQIQCAQCHDHPTDAWTREQFHQFAAFFAGARARRLPKKAGRGIEIVFNGRPRYTMPDLDDPSKKIRVDPAFFLARSEAPIPPNLTAADRRVLAADLIVAQDNPWFARAFVNRVWASLLGQGFYEPVDDLGPDRRAQAPEVLEALASQWQRGGYDIKWLFRTILNTDAYQRTSRSADTPAGGTAFAAACPAPLGADQILDALGRTLGFDPDNLAPRLRRLAGFGRVPGGRDLRAAVDFLYGVDPSTPPGDIVGTIPQALFLMNNPLVDHFLRADRGTVLGTLLDDHPDDDDAIEALYLRVLARTPNTEECRACLQYLARVGDRREGFEDIHWALINSTEFVSRH